MQRGALLLATAGLVAASSLRVDAQRTDIERRAEARAIAELAARLIAEGAHGDVVGLLASEGTSTRWSAFTVPCPGLHVVQVTPRAVFDQRSITVVSLDDAVYLTGGASRDDIPALSQALERRGDQDCLRTEDILRLGDPHGYLGAVELAASKSSPEIDRMRSALARQGWRRDSTIRRDDGVEVEVRTALSRTVGVNPRWVPVLHVVIRSRTGVVLAVRRTLGEFDDP